jgi:hypothetical protein
VRYFANLISGRIALWFFLIWYLATVIHHFDRPVNDNQVVTPATVKMCHEDSTPFSRLKPQIEVGLIRAFGRRRSKIDIRCLTKERHVGHCSEMKRIQNE